MELKIMTFNVLNGWNKTNIGERDDLAASVVLSEKPDVIGFQEVDTCYRNADDVPLSTLIAEYYSEAGEEHTTWNPIFYNKERFCLVEFGEIPFEKGTVYNYPRGGLSGFRTVSYALLEELGTKERFFLLNLHYDYNGKDASITAENQLDESKQVIALSKDLLKKHGAGALFVTGDYNSKINGVPCVTMLENGFTDTYSVAVKKDNKGTCTALGKALWGEYNNAAIDHIFYMGEKELRVNTYDTVDSIRDASDHAPVLITVEIN